MTNEAKKTLLANRINVIIERGKSSENLIKKLNRQLRNL